MLEGGRLVGESIPCSGFVSRTNEKLRMRCSDPSKLDFSILFSFSFLHQADRFVNAETPMQASCQGRGQRASLPLTLSTFVPNTTKHTPKSQIKLKLKIIKINKTMHLMQKALNN
ncbi:hypothetical protein Tsp_01735 [Trichinella spiralis]|uniref:hypothetical protein n=1 Tax=Trichinella spiralis TaxID=6334 RepID=UPI0001EFCA78|nr:hypothetical protein Tsp_01735 [Trichinella spiralis]